MKCLNKKIKLKPEAYVINRPISAGEFSIYSFVRFVTELITPREWMLIGTASLMIALFGIIVPEINRIVLGRYIEMPLEKALPLLMFACLGMAIVYIIRTLLRCIREVLTASVCLHTQQKVEAAFLGRILLLPMEYS